MANIPHARMSNHNHGSHCWLYLHGAPRIEVQEGCFASIPYPLVRTAMIQGWGLSETETWPPRRDAMSPPAALAPGDIVTLPDGSEIVVPAPFNQALDIPERFRREMEAAGWTALAQFA